MEEKEIDKIFKPGKIQLIFAIVLAVIGAILIGIALYIDSNKGKIATDLHELIYNYQDEEGEYASININTIPYGFAIENETLKYYFVMDEQDFLYIARITDKTYEEMEKAYEADKENFSYELKGYVFKIPKELKKLGIEAYNEAFEENEEVEKMTNSNFEEYVGSVYLDETYTPQSSNASTLIVISVFSFIGALVFLVTFITSKATLKKIDSSRIEEAKEELKSSNVKSYSKQKLYLTDRYVVSRNGGIYILEYREILWAYNLINYYRGVATGKSLMACTVNKKRFAIGYSSNANDDTNDEIMREIKLKNPDLRIGFTDENKKFFKEYKKENI